MHNTANLTPAQAVIVRAHARMRRDAPPDPDHNHDRFTPCRQGDDTFTGCPAWRDPDDHYDPVDYAVARVLDVRVEAVGEALVAAGLRPPVWWIG